MQRIASSFENNGKSSAHKSHLFRSGKLYLTSKIWDLWDEDCEIIPALFLSYHNLPTRLEMFCFLCLIPQRLHVFQGGFNSIVDG